MEYISDETMPRDETMPGESITHTTTDKMTREFFTRKIGFYLNVCFRRLLSNSLLKADFDYNCGNWYHNLTNGTHQVTKINVYNSV